jgi:methionyl-tRNA synthetase
MLEKYFGGDVPAKALAGSEARAFGPRIAPNVREALAALDRTDIAAALSAGIAVVRCVDQYINETAPFKLAKTIDASEAGEAARARLGEILACCAEGVRIASVLLAPAMPDKVAQLWQAWNLHNGSANAGLAAKGVSLADNCTFAGPHGLHQGKVSKGEVLFMRADPAAPVPGV